MLVRILSVTINENRVKLIDFTYILFMMLFYLDYKLVSFLDPSISLSVSS